MRTLFGVLPALACAAMLLVCLPTMLRGTRTASSAEPPARHREIADLRAEIAALRQERSPDSRKVTQDVES